MCIVHLQPQKVTWNIFEENRMIFGTKGQGLIMWPGEKLEVDWYVDSDFSGLWSHGEPQDPTSVKSRLGYIIHIANCLVTWTSKLQNDISLSGVWICYPEHCNERPIAIERCILKEVYTKQWVWKPWMSLKSMVWEDNNGALLVKMKPPQMMPRLRHYGLKYHWSRSKLRILLNLQQVEKSNMTVHFVHLCIISTVVFGGIPSIGHGSCRIKYDGTNLNVSLIPATDLSNLIKVRV